jgi:hypothetical protein
VGFYLQAQDSQAWHDDDEVDLACGASIVIRYI